LVFCYIILAMLTILAAGKCFAAEEGKPADRTVEERNDLGLFLGGTHTSDEDGFSVGIDYERRLSHLFGIGGVIEYTAGDVREGVSVLPFVWHAWKELKLVGAPGTWFSSGSASDEIMLRLGGEYGFEIGRGYELAPGLFFDLTQEETAIVYGASFAKSF